VASQPFSIIIIWAVGLSVGLAFGALNGLLCAKFKVVPFIATLATMSIARGVGLMISRAKVYRMNELSVFSQSTVGGTNFPVVLLLQIALLLIFSFIYYKTPFGRHIDAVGNDVNAAKNVGIKVVRVRFFAFLICGFTASIAAMLLAGQIANVTTNFANGNEFLVISGAVLGGTSLFGGKGNMIPGALVGIVLVQTILNGLLLMNASPYAYTIIRGLIIFVAVVLDSVNYKGELR
jgi:ribose/xylose/arabinose/galactoside ABC-type transport system permease subunit